MSHTYSYSCTAAPPPPPPLPPPLPPPPLLQLQGTGSSFGTPLSDVRGSLVLSEPLDGGADLLGEYKVPPSADPIPDPKPDPKPDPEPDPKPEPTSNYNQASRPGYP